ncbi:MAG: hypothetical protein DDT36_00705 [Firmicutes bacterium]|nr:hypothetical protein [Bacillota bacterium]
MAQNDMFRTAIAADSQGFIDVLEMVQQVWESADMVRWLETPQVRWQGESPLDLIADGRSETVLDLLDTFWGADEG